jgi:hypothetical protein
MDDCTARADTAFLVLDESLPVVHTALVSYYGFSDPEAEAFKDTLAVWFHRVIRRQTPRAQNPEELREQLLFVACKYARAFQLARSTNGSFDGGVPGSLQTPPEEVALALLNRFQPMDRTL